MPKAYQLTDTDDLQTVEKWIVVADVPFEVIFQREVIAIRAAELLCIIRTLGEGIAMRRFATFAVFLKSEIKMLPCIPCNGTGDIPRDGCICSCCHGSGEIKVTVEVLDESRPGGYEDRELRQLKAFIKGEISEEIGFDRDKDCPDKTNERRVGYNGDCERCPYLLREDIENEELDVIGHRWMCRKRQREVKVAERLMHNEGQDGKA